MLDVNRSGDTGPWRRNPGCGIRDWDEGLAIRDSCLSGLRIQINGQVSRGDPVFDAAGWNVDLRNPQERVQYDLALIDVTPVRVRVAAGEAKAPPATGPLVDPHHRLDLAAVRDDVRVRSRGRYIRSFPHLIAWFRREDGHRARHGRCIGCPTDVEVPLVVRAERPHAARHGMI